MEYQNGSRSSTHASRPSYPHHEPYGNQYTPHQTSRPPINNSIAPNQVFQPPNGYHDPHYAPGPSSSSKHRPPDSTPNQQQASQKAFAVAIPTLANSPYAINGNLVNNTRQQPTLATPTQSSLNARNGHISRPGPQQKHTEAPVDYQLLLLSLAEEYLAAAHGMGSMAALAQRETDRHEYYKLIATGLGCMEAVLGHLKIPPEREANARLRYATVLYEETENMMEAEEALSKGVSLCDRHRFFDLKYNMQHLLARMLFKKNPRAALKFLEGVTKDVEAYQHLAWVYAFRFLKVSLHLKMATHQDMQSALSQLGHIMSLSSGYGDKAILAIATTMEALLSLRHSSDADSIENAQRNLATIRSLQLDPKISELPQLAVLAALVDLCCHLQQYDPGQAIAKMQVMQAALKTVNESESWAADGSFVIPISGARMPSCRSRNGVIRREEDGSLVFMLNWISKDDVYNLGYLLSGIALAHKNTTDGQKSEHMLEEGIKKFTCM